MFVDEVDIHVEAGRGGPGALSFRREKFVPRGGPDGGDGGHGGSVWIVASPHLNTLVNFRYHPRYRAQRGGHGKGANRHGAKGQDLELSVPIGTLVLEQVDDELRVVADLVAEGQRERVAEGGRGGRGNATFATATNRAPRRTEPGLPGEIKTLKLQLKLLADVGLVGFPNAGKSTLIARISAARPKIADYPFTTLTPNLGVVRLDDERSFVVADVPGLIEGAHRGLGLGHRFLRHLERTEVLVHLIDLSGTGRDPVDDYETVARELELFSVELAAKAQIVAANKIDALDEPERLERLTKHLAARGITILPISAVTGQGVPALLEAMWRNLSDARARAAADGDEAPSDDERIADRLER